jgi:transcriptional regulator with XRE-family HTH domain
VSLNEPLNASDASTSRTPADAPNLGDRVREERLRLGISVRQLARDIGVSPSLISQIETSKSQPSVSTLYAITTALGISIADVFEASEDSGLAAVSAGTPAAAGTILAALGAARGHSLGPVLARGDRQVLTLESGVRWERLGQLPHSHVDFLQITYEPGSSSSGSGTLMRHSGTEYGYLLSGELVLTLGFEEHRIRVGDSVCFESTRPHGYRNDGRRTAVGIWFVVEPGS